MDARLSITEKTVGDDLDLVCEVSGLPVGATLSKAWVRIKRRETDADSAALVTVATMTGFTYVDTPTRTAKFTIRLSAAQTAAIGATAAHFAIRVKTNSNLLDTSLRGIIKLDPDVAGAEPA